MIFGVLRPLMRFWFWSRETTVQSVPRPVDAPVARVPGPSPVRVLLLGNGPAAGWGVASHQLALPGQLARVVAEQTERGVQIDARVDRSRRLHDLPELLDRARLCEYDAVVLLAGMSDVVNLTPVEEWRRDLASLLDRIMAGAPQAALLVVGVQPVRSVSTYAGAPGAIAERYRGTINGATVAICAPRGIAYLELAAPSRPPSRPGHRSPGVFAEWAAHIAGPLAALLPAADATACPPRQAEPDRQAAVERLDPAGEPDQRLDRVTRLARRAFGTSTAAITLLDGDWNRFRSLSGGDARSMPRAHAFCRYTVQGTEALVIEDLAADARFDDNPFVHGPDGFRFYAGYPIESPDGYRVGALCVLDTRPRSADTLDRAALVDLALIAQRELWTVAGAVSRN